MSLKEKITNQKRKFERKSKATELIDFLVFFLQNENHFLVIFNTNVRDPQIYLYRPKKKSTNISFTIKRFQGSLFDFENFLK
jgi:hypothetical protein